MKRKRRADSTVAREIRALLLLHQHCVRTGQDYVASRAQTAREALQWEHGLNGAEPASKVLSAFAH